MLASLTDSIVISEAPPINFALRARPGDAVVEIEQRVSWLRGVVNALGRPRKGNEKYYFIKFDAWHMLDFPLIRRSFPDVPWIFLYRDPIEVLASQAAQPSVYMLPGSAPAGLPPVVNGSLMTTTLIESLASTLAGISEAALAHSSDGGTLINYQQLPDVVSAYLFELFRVLCSAQDFKKIEQTTRLHAKNDAAPLVNDSRRKQQEATLAIREAAAKWVYPVYKKLEAARLLRGPW